MSSPSSSVSCSGYVPSRWTRDSAYRFFPLVRHPDFGLALHPFDLATNKALALVGQLEVRDWVDLIHASDRIQPLGLSGVGGLRQGSRLQPRGDPLAGGALGQLFGGRSPRPGVRGRASRPGRPLTSLAYHAGDSETDRRRLASHGSRPVRPQP
jgi:hypothetical protein